MEENFRFTIVCEADVATHPYSDRCAAHFVRRIFVVADGGTATEKRNPFRFKIASW